MDGEDSGGGTSDTSTYQVLAAQDSYPKQICQFDEPSISIPFVPLAGEYAQYVGRTTDGLIALSNYRLFLQQRETTYHIPLGVIETAENRDILFLYLMCKDTKSYKCTFANTELCTEWHRRLTKALGLPQRLENVFSFAFYMWNSEENRELHTTLLEPDGPQSYASKADRMFDEEVRRLGFDLGGAWRISVANNDYQLCSTYPRKLVVPASINDNILESVARFRSARRIPAIVWRHPNGAVIARSSQPEVGWLGWRSSEDEDLVKAIAEACAYDSPSENLTNGTNGTNGIGSNNLVPLQGDKDAVTPVSDIPSLCDLPEAKAQADIKKVLIIDARSYATAVANRARGGGCECPEYYPTCEIQFMNLANIHTIRKSNHAVRTLVSSPADIPNWLSMLEGSRWLSHLSGLLKAAVTVVQAVVREARPVLVHCSDGWDRTPQITALSQLLMDPYYRTMQGFQVLVEREWIEFGHKFSDRCGSGRSCEDINERCPVFLQWLDCVHHLLYMFPTAFQFNQSYLVKLAQHVYSNLFGTFLCNSSQERAQAEIGERTYSVWSLLRLNRHRYTNYLYTLTHQVLYPSCHTKDLRLWTSVYMPEMGEVTADPHTITHPTEGDEEEEEEPAASGELVKTKSCDDLLAGMSPPPHNPLRRSSDPNIRDSCPNMAMLNSALGSELTSDDPNVEDQGEDLPLPQELEANEDSISEATGDHVNDESLTLCPSVENSETHECGNNLLGEVYESGIENGEEASEYMEPLCVNQETEQEGVLYNREVEDVPCLNRGPNSRFMDLAEQSIEGSTDTLVAEMGVIASEEKVPREKHNEMTPLLNGRSGEESSKSLLNGKCCPFMNGMSEDSEVSTVNRKNMKKGPMANGISLENGQEDREKAMSHMGAIVSSSCNVCLRSRKLLDESSNDTWRSAGLLQDGAVPTRGIISGPGSRVSLYSTPMHSRTPSSCIPSTPCEDRFGGESSRGSSYATIDGLHNVSDEVTKRLHQILQQHQAELEALKRDLLTTRQALCNQVLHNKCSHHHHHDTTEDQVRALHSAFAHAMAVLSAMEELKASANTQTEVKVPREEVKAKAKSRSRKQTRVHSDKKVEGPAESGFKVEVDPRFLNRTGAHSRTVILTGARSKTLTPSGPRPNGRTWGGTLLNAAFDFTALLFMLHKMEAEPIVSNVKVPPSIEGQEGRVKVEKLVNIDTADSESKANLNGGSNGDTDEEYVLVTLDMLADPVPVNLVDSKSSDGKLDLLTGDPIDDDTGDKINPEGSEHNAGEQAGTQSSTGNSTQCESSVVHEGINPNLEEILVAEQDAWELVVASAVEPVTEPAVASPNLGTQEEAPTEEEGEGVVNYVLGRLLQLFLTTL